MSTRLPPNDCRGDMAKETKGVGDVGVILLMEEIDSQGFTHPRWLGMGFLPSTVSRDCACSLQSTNSSTLLHV